MRHYHFFVQSRPGSSAALAALDFARSLDPKTTRIMQVYFYEEGVFHAVDASLVESWKSLSSEIKACQTYLEEWSLKPLAGVEAAGLVDFFSKHWQDQGQLVQF